MWLSILNVTTPHMQNKPALSFKKILSVFKRIKKDQVGNLQSKLLIALQSLQISVYTVTLFWDLQIQWKLSIRKHAHHVCSLKINTTQSLLSRIWPTRNLCQTIDILGSSRLFKLASSVGARTFSFSKSVRPALLNPKLSLAMTCSSSLKIVSQTFNNSLKVCSVQIRTPLG